MEVSRGSIGHRGRRWNVIGRCADEGFRGGAQDLFITNDLMVQTNVSIKGLVIDAKADNHAKLICDMQQHESMNA